MLAIDVKTMILKKYSALTAPVDSEGATALKHLAMVSTVPVHRDMPGLCVKTDLSFCDTSTCSNGGTCIEGDGTDIFCSCVPGFTGMLCDDDIDTFCLTDPLVCYNGGSCIEGYGNTTECMCARGFTGVDCREDNSTAIFCSMIHVLMVVHALRNSEMQLAVSVSVGMMEIGVQKMTPKSNFVVLLTAQMVEPVENYMDQTQYAIVSV